MGMLTAAAILAAKDLTPEVVAVPEWGGEVLVRGLSGADREAHEESLWKEEGGKRVRNLEHWRTKLLVRCLVDEQGNRLFTEQQVTDLGGRSGAVIDRLYDVAARLSGLGPEQAKKEQETKNV